MVPRAGIEPARTCNVRGILSPLCLPVSPPRHWGVDQIRTGEWQFCRLLPYHLGTTPTFKKARPHKEAFWAKDGIRTHDPHVGNVMLYQLSYFRNTYQKKIEDNIMSNSKLNQEFYLWLWPLWGSGKGPKRSTIFFFSFSMTFNILISSLICLSREYFLNEK